MLTRCALSLLVRRFINFLVVGLALFPSGVSAQTKKPSTGHDLVFTRVHDQLSEKIPDYILATLVHQALLDFVQVPPDVRNEYILAPGISYSWLPTIENVAFVIIDADEIDGLRQRGVSEYYFFESVHFARWKYAVAVGRGNRWNGSGLVLTYRWKGGSLVREDRRNGGFGYATGRCGSSLRGCGAGSLPED